MTYGNSKNVDTKALVWKGKRATQYLCPSHTQFMEGHAYISAVMPLAAGRMEVHTSVELVF